jgi:hypothetical protein
MGNIGGHYFPRFSNYEYFLPNVGRMGTRVMKISIDRRRLINQKGFEKFLKYKKVNPMPDPVEFELEVTDVIDISPLEIRALQHITGLIVEEELIQDSAENYNS